MSNDRPFSVTAGRCLAAGVAAAVVNYFYPAAPLALVVNVICLWVLYRRALREAADGDAEVDTAIAAEVMVAFGVLSLVLGLASIISRLILGDFDSVAIQQGETSGLLAFLPFVEGLVTAGLAPFLAVLLRMTIAESSATVDPAGDLTDLARATAGLTRHLNAAGTAIETFRNGAAAASASTVGLASAMKTEADRWGLALFEGEAHVKSFGEAASIGRSEVSGLAGETQRLRAATTDAATMLEELSRLIESIERFVAPREPA